jgi:hypothetical protein
MGGSGYSPNGVSTGWRVESSRNYRHGSCGRDDRERLDASKEASPEAFKAANRKGDGRLTLQEYVNALFIDFDKADTGKDGSLTFEEIEVYSRTTGR